MHTKLAKVEQSESTRLQRSKELQVFLVPQSSSDGSSVGQPKFKMVHASLMCPGICQFGQEHMHDQRRPDADR